MVIELAFTYTTSHISHMLHFHAIPTQKWQAAKWHCVNWCCRVKLILSRMRLTLPAIRQNSGTLLYFEGHWSSDHLQPITTGQFALSLPSSGNIRDLLQWHEWTTYSYCIHVVLYRAHPWSYACCQVFPRGKTALCILASCCVCLSVSM